MADTIDDWFGQLELRFRSDRAVGLDAVCGFELAGDGGGSWTVRIADGRCAVEKAPAADPTVALACTADTWRRIVAGQQDPQLAFMTGRLKVRGDTGLALRLKSLFDLG